MVRLWIEGVGFGFVLVHIDVLLLGHDVIVPLRLGMVLPIELIFYDVQGFWPFISNTNE